MKTAKPHLTNRIRRQEHIVVPELDVEERALELLVRHRRQLQVVRAVPHGLARLAPRRPGGLLADDASAVVNRPHDDKRRDGGAVELMEAWQARRG